MRLVKVLWQHRGVVRTPCVPTIPSCLMGKVRFLIINVLNDCCLCMCLIVCIYVGMSGRIPFKGGGGGGGRM